MKFREALLRISLLVVASSSTTIHAGEIKATVEQYLRLTPNTEAVHALDNMILKLVLGSCLYASQKDRMWCTIEGVHELCSHRGIKSLPPSECLDWGDLFAAAYTAGPRLLEPTDLWQWRKADDAGKGQLLIQHYRRRTQELYQAYRVSAHPCPQRNDPACESGEIEKFCRSYCHTHSLPLGACFALVLRGKVFPTF